MTKNGPISIRRNIENYGDPYLDMRQDEVAICKKCRSVYAGKRWQLEEQASKDLAKAKQVGETLCPACRKIQDRMPGGILQVTGNFMGEHEEEIVNMINHINRKSMLINPLERIMDIEQSENGMVVLTTNEKLAQKLGRALYKAYSGNIEYKWSEDTKLARVNWHRD